MIKSELTYQFVVKIWLPCGLWIFVESSTCTVMNSSRKSGFDFCGCGVFWLQVKVHQTTQAAHMYGLSLFIIQACITRANSCICVAYVPKLPSMRCSQCVTPSLLLLPIFEENGFKITASFDLIMIARLRAISHYDEWCKSDPQSGADLP